MFRISKSRRLVVPVVGVCLVLASLLHAQQKEQFAQAQKENSAALKNYTWKSRTELVMKGESKNVKLEQVRYDLDGKQQKTDISGAQPQPTEEAGGGRGRRRGGGRLKQKAVDKKKAEFAELHERTGPARRLLRPSAPGQDAGFRPKRDGRARAGRDGGCAHDPGNQRSIARGYHGCLDRSRRAI